MTREFPAGFLFGAATSATQIEGGCAGTDWAAWTQATGRETPLAGCDSWNRWREDVALLRELGLNAYRFSIEWARVEPEPGRFDQAALDRYREMLGALVDAGIVPMVTLHHFSLPRWLAGGLLAPELPVRLTAYTRVVARALGDLCRLWITINEPNVVVAQGYLQGVWPPAERRPDHAVRAHHNLLRAHVDMYLALHEILPDAQVGVAHHLRVIEAERAEKMADRAGAWLMRTLFNDAFAAAISDGWGPLGRMFAPSHAVGTQDFFGLNYYTRDLVHVAPGDVRRNVPADTPQSDLGWEIYPEGLEWLLSEWAARSGKPMYVTENGLADAHDSQRTKFLEDHLRQILRAFDDTIDVRGYFHWSLMDNFEWADGYRPRFGLCEVDRTTLDRKPRPSARRYAEIARTRRL